MTKKIIPNFSEYKYFVEASNKHLGYIVFSMKVLPNLDIEITEIICTHVERKSTNNWTRTVKNHEFRSWLSENNHWWHNFVLKDDKELLAFTLRYK